MIGRMTCPSYTGPLLAAALAAALTSPASAAGQHPAWAWPLEPVPQVVRPFQPPTSPYGPGHRGVDLSGTFGQPVSSVAPGIVTFAGSVAGRGVVVVDHGVLTSTYQPVNAMVSRGVHVGLGEPLGSLELVGSHCLPDACLHLGAKRGDTYLDPLRLLPARAVRLKPLAGLAQGGSIGAPHWRVPRGPLQPRLPGQVGTRGHRARGARWGGALGAAVGLTAGGGRGPPLG
jgi:murein DD-endopeptidase MepM/ murein hydrolase activator NlpD